MQLLSFQQEILKQLCAVLSEEKKQYDAMDGLVILARGLGLDRLLLSLVHIHTTPKNLVLLINTPQHELITLKSMLSNTESLRFHIIDSSQSAAER